MEIFSQLTISIGLFHTNNLAHFDLKPANIFIDKNVNAILGLFLILIRIYLCVYIFIEVILENLETSHNQTLRER
jgi:serine/threonine protein kinase